MPHRSMGDGAKLFATNCAVCHQASGEGIPGVFPPLKSNGVVQAPDDCERTSWGNHAPLAAAREVAAVRATLKH